MGTSTGVVRKGLATLAASAALVAVAGTAPAEAHNRGRHWGHHQLRAFMTGEQEAPTPGDPNGWGKARIWFRNGQVCYKLTWHRIAAPTAAHIHEAPPGEPGPVVLPLPIAAEDQRGPHGSTRGCVSADAALIREIKANPGDYYVNIHNAPYPAGAIRGQLHR